MHGIAPAAGGRVNLREFVPNQGLPVGNCLRWRTRQSRVFVHAAITPCRRLLALLDLTSLGEDDSPIRDRTLCASARTPHGQPAAVCVYPEHVTSAREALAGIPIKIASVVNFPEGGDDLAAGVPGKPVVRLQAGADEIDMVLAWALRAGDTARAKAGVEACRRPAEPASP